MGQPVVHFEIMGKDAGKLHSFYSEMFDWKINAMPMGDGSYGMVGREDNLNPDGIGIGGGVGSSASGPSYVTVYVEVPDVEAALAKAASIGGQRVSGPDDIGQVEIGTFLDPEGHLIGLVKSGS
jgi:uncharacterized protein